MIRKYVSIIALSLALVSSTSTFAPSAMEYKKDLSIVKVEEEKKEDETRHHKHKMGKEHAMEDIKMLSNAENLKLLSDEDKKALKEINACLMENKDISKGQIKTLIELKDKVAKCKLGEKDYKKFKELMKKERKDCLNEEEKKELEGYLKKIYCK